MTAVEQVDITVALNCDLWMNEIPELETFVKRITLHCLRHMDHKISQLCQKHENFSIGVAIVLTNDHEIRELNSQFRNIDSATNVLSFSADFDIPQILGQELVLGDIIMSYDIIKQEAMEQHKSFQSHTTHLLIHGLLHLLGYDHIKDEDALEMEQLERDILADLGIDDPYLWRDEETSDSMAGED